MSEDNENIACSCSGGCMLIFLCAMTLYVVIHFVVKYW